LRFFKFFKTAEIAFFKPEERKAYEDSLKYYRDLRNALDTSREEGKIEVAQSLIAMGFDDGKVAQATGLTINEVADLKKNLR
jgi:predicted transposase/invertase (TIGR01784 family)